MRLPHTVDRVPPLHYKPKQGQSVHQCTQANEQEAQAHRIQLINPGMAPPGLVHTQTGATPVRGARTPHWRWGLDWPSPTYDPDTAPEFR